MKIRTTKIKEDKRAKLYNKLKPLKMYIYIYIDNTFVLIFHRFII